MAKFDVAFGITLANEGTYCNTPGDTGGETYCGISRNNWPNWEGWAFVDSLKAANSSPTEWAAQLSQYVKAFYKANFWDRFMGDQIDSQEIANELFDSGVNMGSKVEGQFLQDAINSLNVGEIGDLDVDGVVGKGTIAALNALSVDKQKAVLWIVNSLQCVRYLNITHQNQSQRQFMFGWVRARVEFANA